ncbi:MAG: hypothetical protein ABIV47_06885 [Roseiflexaceae bacterium]
MRYSLRHILPHTTLPITPRAGPRPRAARSRWVVLVLIVLLVIFVVFMNITGGYPVGGPMLGSILLIGLGTANYAW